MEIYYNENFDVYIMYLVGALMIIIGIVFIDIEAKNITSRKDIPKKSKIRLAIFKFLIILFLWYFDLIIINERSI